VLVVAWWGARSQWDKAVRGGLVVGRKVAALWGEGQEWEKSPSRHVLWEVADAYNGVPG
jgi:hypothetical protein